MKRHEMIEALLQRKFPNFDEVLRTFGMDDREDADARELSEEVETARMALEAMSDDDLEMELEAGEPARLLRLRADEQQSQREQPDEVQRRRGGAKIRAAKEALLMLYGPTEPAGIYMDVMLESVNELQRERGRGPVSSSTLQRARNELWRSF